MYVDFIVLWPQRVYEIYFDKQTLDPMDFICKNIKNTIKGKKLIIPHFNCVKMLYYDVCFCKIDKKKSKNKKIKKVLISKTRTNWEPGNNK